MVADVPADLPQYVLFLRVDVAVRAWSNVQHENGVPAMSLAHSLDDGLRALDVVGAWRISPAGVEVPPHCTRLITYLRGIKANCVFAWHIQFPHLVVLTRQWQHMRVIRDNRLR